MKMVRKRGKIRAINDGSSYFHESIPSVMYFRNVPATRPKIVQASQPISEPLPADNCVLGLLDQSPFLFPVCKRGITESQRLRNRRRLHRRFRERTIRLRTHNPATKGSRMEKAPRSLPEISCRSPNVIGKEILRARRERTRKKHKRKNGIHNKLNKSQFVFGAGAHRSITNAATQVGGGKNRTGGEDGCTSQESDCEPNDVPDNRANIEDTSVEEPSVQHPTGDQAVLYAKKDRKLDSIEAMAMLDKLDMSKVSRKPPSLPKNGEFYLFPSGIAEKWIVDGYRWQSGTGFAPLPSKNKHWFFRKCKNVVTSSTETNKGDPKFKMYIYKLTVDPSPLLVHYLGDPSIYKDFPHGLSKKHPKRDFIRKHPDIAKAAKDNLDKAPQEIYDELIVGSMDNSHHGYRPRDLKQIENYQADERARKRLTHDELYNVFALGFEYSDFFQQYRADFDAANNLVFLASRPLLRKLNDLLKPPVGIYSKLPEVYYDTTFGLGQFYVSVFSFRHYMLKRRKLGAGVNRAVTVPAAFLIHQRKFAIDHKGFLASLVNLCPRLALEPFAFISDREFRNVSEFFPKATHLFCWNHLLSDVRRWSMNHHGSEDQRLGGGSYVEDVKTLFQSRTAQIFFIKLYHFQECYWSPEFYKYFKDHVLDDVIEKAGRWVIEPTGLYDPWSGITSNASESMNKLIKKDFPMSTPMDETALRLFYLTGHMNYQLDCGICNDGKYCLINGFEEYKKNITDVKCSDIFPPSLVVAKVKEQLKKLADTEQRVPETVATEKQRKTDDIPPSVFDDSAEEMKRDLKSRAQDEENIMQLPMQEKLLQKASGTQMEVAETLCAQGKIALVSQQGVFSVDAGPEKKYNVQLFPKEKCTCPATRTCYHILACRLAIGMNNLGVRGKKNLNRLFAKSRPDADRKWKKAPRTRDYDRDAHTTTAPQRQSFQKQVIHLLSKEPEKRHLKDHNTPPCKKARIADSHAPLWSRLTSTLPEVPSTTKNIPDHGVYATTEDQYAAEDAESQSSRPSNQPSSVDEQENVLSPPQSKPKENDARPSNKKNDAFSSNVPPVLPPVPSWRCKSNGIMVSNSCTIDNALTIIYLHIVQNPHIFDMITPDLLKQAISFFMNQQFDEGKLLLAKAVAMVFPATKKTARLYDLYGNEHEMFFDQFKAVWAADAQSICTEECDEPKCFVPLNGFELKSNAKLDVQRMLTEGFISSARCNKPFRNGGGPCRNRRQICNVEFSETCFMIPIKNHASTTIDSFDEEIKINNMRFVLAGITLHRPTHYSAAIKWHNDWFLYDGIVEGRKFVPLPNRYAKPSTAIYMRV